MKDKTREYIKEMLEAKLQRAETSLICAAKFNYSSKHSDLEEVRTAYEILEDFLKDVDDED